MEKLKKLYGGDDGYQAYKNAATVFFAQLPHDQAGDRARSYAPEGTATTARLKASSDRMLTELRDTHGAADITDLHPDTIGGVGVEYRYNLSRPDGKLGDFTGYETATYLAGDRLANKACH